MFSKIKKYVVGFFVLAGGILFAFLSGKSAGRKQEKLGGLKKKIKNTQKSIKNSEKLQKNVKKSLKSKEKALKEIMPAKWTSNTLRPPMVIGPRDPAVLDIFKMVKSGVIVGPGLSFKKKEYSFICVFDLVNGLKELTQKKPQGLFYISHKGVLTFEQLIKSVQEALNKKSLFYVPIPNLVLRFVANISAMLPVSSRLTKDKVNELIPMAWACSNDKLTSQTSFTPRWDIDKTINITIQDYKKRNWL